MKTRTLRAWLWVHKWSSLVSMLFLLMLCITGLPLIFAHEIHDLFDPHPPVREVVTETSPPTFESLVQRAVAARPAGHVVPYLYFVEDEPRVVGIATAATMRPPPTGDWEGLHFQVFDQRDGLLLGSLGVKKGFMYLMIRLHVDLFADLPGTLFLGVMGLLLVVAIVSGVVAYAPFMRKLDFATIRAARGPRVLWLDLHNLLGIVTVAWVLVVGVTGVLQREFAVEAPNRVWVTDITYIRTHEGWLYLAVVLDLFSRQVVGWSMQSRIDGELVLNALLMAVWRRRPSDEVLVHSDQGSQFTGYDWLEFLKAHRLKPSMSRRGNCHDNAVAESFFQLLKRERIRRRTYATREQARQDVFDYIEMFYNPKRRHGNNNRLSPVEYERRYFTTLVSV
ncbi:MAG: IS3 family transposase [Gemmatimonadales bacterium]|nr:IS3 family transposase [Gemmatimonadales bacterium]